VGAGVHACTSRVGTRVPRLYTVSPAERRGAGTAQVCAALAPTPPPSSLPLLLLPACAHAGDGKVERAVKEGLLLAVELSRGLTPPPFAVAPPFSSPPYPSASVVWLTRCLDASGQVVAPDAAAFPAAAALQAWDARVPGTAVCSFLVPWGDDSPDRVAVVTRPLVSPNVTQASLALLPLAAVQPLSGQRNYVSLCTVDGSRCGWYTADTLILGVSSSPNSPKYGYYRTYASFEVAAPPLSSPCAGVSGYFELRPSVVGDMAVRWPPSGSSPNVTDWERNRDQLLIRPRVGQWGGVDESLCFTAVQYR
jgi:hypothetical protein